MFGPKVCATHVSRHVSGVDQLCRLSANADFSGQADVRSTPFGSPVVPEV